VSSSYCRIFLTILFFFSEITSKKYYESYVFQRIAASRKLLKYVQKKPKNVLLPKPLGIPETKRRTLRLINANTWTRLREKERLMT